MTHLEYLLYRAVDVVGSSLLAVGLGFLIGYTL